MIYTPETERDESLAQEPSIVTPDAIREDHIAKDPKVLTPQNEKEGKGPDKIHVVTKKYGETTTVLKRGFETEVKKYEGEYQVELPEEVMDICKELHGMGGRALLVGGSVRDTVINKELPEMHLKPKDFDLEVYGIPPEQLRKILGTKFGLTNVDLAGDAFEVIKVHIEGWDLPLDFSIPRRDSKVGEGHRGFKITGDPTMTIDEASTRRDLTCNSIAYDPLTKTLYDAYGGVEDIKNRTIDVTDEKAFREDPLRVLRVMQFAARFNFEITENTKNICKDMVESGVMDNLPRERIKEEVSKLFEKCIKPSAGFEFAREIGYVEKYWPEAFALIDVPQEARHHPEGDVWTHTLQVMDAAAAIAEREIAKGKIHEKDKAVLVAAALCHDFGKPETTEFIDGAYKSIGHEPAGLPPTKSFLERLYADPKAKGLADITEKALPLVAEHLKPRDYWETEVKKGIDQTGAVRKLATRLLNGSKKQYPEGGKSSIYMLALLAEADQRGRNGEGTTFLDRDQVKDLEEWQGWLLKKAAQLNIEYKAPVRIFTGEDFLKKKPDLKSGPWMGMTLDAVFADQLDGTVTTQEEALANALAYLEIFREKVAAHAKATGEDPRDIWRALRNLEDPRTYLQT